MSTLPEAADEIAELVWAYQRSAAERGYLAVAADDLVELLERAAGFLDSHGHLHAPAGAKVGGKSVGGRFISKALADALDADLPRMDGKLAKIVGRGDDGLDELTDRQLRSLSHEYDVPGRSNDLPWVPLPDDERRRLLASLRQLGALAPDVGRDLTAGQQEAWLQRQRELRRLVDVQQIPKLNPNLVGLRDLIASAREAAESGDRTQLSGGAVGFTERVDLPDGRRLFSKRNGPWQARSAKDVTDAETATYLVGKALNAPVPRVVRTADDHIYTDWVDGELGIDLFTNKLLAELDGPPDNPELQQFVSSGAGKRLGLLDVLVGNGDRHTSNWLRSADGELVGIDHGNAWWYAADALAEEDDDEFRTHMSEPIHGVFVRNGWFDFDRLEHDGTLVMVDTDVWTAADVRRTRRRLTALRGSFQEMGREEWLDYSLRVLDLLEPHAKGKRSIFRD